MNIFIEWDGDVWAVLGTGAQSEDSTFCHLASLSRFQRQRNGANPVQVQDQVPTALLEDCQKPWRLVEIILYLRMVAGYEPQQDGPLRGLTNDERYRIIQALRDELAERTMTKGESLTERR